MKMNAENDQVQGHFPFLCSLALFLSRSQSLFYLIHVLGKIQ